MNTDDGRFASQFSSLRLPVFHIASVHHNSTDQTNVDYDTRTDFIRSVSGNKDSSRLKRLPRFLFRQFCNHFFWTFF